MRDMFIKKAIALALSLSLTGVLLAGCQSGTPSAAGSGSQTSAGTTDGEVVHIKLFTGKIETDIMTTYEQGFVDEGKYMDLTDLN